MSEVGKARDYVNFKGEKHSEKTKKIISGYRVKKIYMYSKEGFYLKCYETVYDCCVREGFSLSKTSKTNTTITKVAKNEMGTYKGYQFRYYKKENIGAYKSKIIKANGKPVIDDKNKKFDTVGECAKFYRVQHKTITEWIKKGKFKFALKGDNNGGRYRG